MDKIVCLRDYPVENQAEIAKGYLRSNGIDADVFKPGPMPIGLAKSFKVMVREEDKEKADRLLKEANV